LWGVDPTVRYKTMCPYFWSYVVTVIILPFLVLVRLFGTWGQDFNGWMLTYRREQKAKKKKEFIKNLELCKSEKEAYKLRKTECWNDFKWSLDYTIEQRIRDMARKYENEVNEKRWAREHKEYLASQKKKALMLARKEKTEAIKESPTFKYISYGVVGVLALFALSVVLFLIYHAVIAINWSLVFQSLGYILLALIGIAIIAGISMFLIKYVFKPIVSWSECRTFDFDCALTRGIGKGFAYIGIGFKYIGFMFEYIWNHGIGPVGRGIGHGFLIFFDTIYKIYKKQCPMITWED